MRSEQPDRIVAVVHDRREGACRDAAVAGWRERLDEVVACIDGDAEHLDARVSRSSLVVLRRWVDGLLRQVARRGGVAPDEPLERSIADVVLVVDELVSNALEHAAGAPEVGVSIGPDRVLVTVSDRRPDDAPILGFPPPLQPSGRGMLVVDAVSRRWGVVIGQTSKAVWAELPWSV